MRPTYNIGSEVYKVVEMVNIAAMGTKYEGRQEFLKDLEVDDVVELKREPQNPHDRNAIGIFRDGKQVGYCPAGVARLVADALDEYGKPVYGVVTRVIGGDSNKQFDFKVLQPLEEANNA